ncbi:MAG: acyloxyacyl hydrolase [Bacteroidales bacterium]|jgi:hypothetical protein|nr:acyloxyacyl hydrolase [Bacteroidales bacterium]
MKTLKNHIVSLMVVVVFCSISHYSTAQITTEDDPAAFLSKTNQYARIEAKALAGFVLPHYSFMNFLSEGWQKGFALHYTIFPAQQTLYDTLWKHPSYGIGARYITLGNTKKLGTLSALYAVFNGQFFRRKLYNHIDYQINTGLGFAHKSLRHSVYNTVISSPLNFFAAINCGATFRVHNNSWLRCGVELQHISNGKTTTPNLGFNSLLFSLSYFYGVVHHREKTILHTVPRPPIEAHRINVLAAGFFKTDDFMTEKKYFTGTALAEYEWLSPFRWWGVHAGGDYFYDRSIAALKPSPQSWAEQRQLMNVGVHTGAFVKYSHVVFLVQVGQYIASNTQSSNFFTRAALRYEWQRLFANVSLRAHGAVAQSIEMGIGYKLRFQ